VRATIGPEHIDALPDGAILANAGAVDDEIDMAYLGVGHTVRDHVEEFATSDGRSLYVVGAGVVVNLSAGEGHPAEIMDLTFSVQALSGGYLMQHGRDLVPKVHTLPAEIDEGIARMKLDALGLKIDALTPAQEAFLRAWEAFE
jgi:adenosylhomocysteinase